MTDGVCVVTFVGVKNCARRHPLEKHEPGLAVRDLAAGEQKGDRAAEPVRQGVDLGAAPAAGAADGLRVFPPLPPEADRCAFTADESISTWAGGPPAVASVWKRSVQTPLAAQRTKRL